MERPYFLTFILFVTGVCLVSCIRKNHRQGFSFNPKGYYYQLISFEEDNSDNHQNKVVWLSACFKTQADSIFWDSSNNLNDRFYLNMDTSLTTNFLMSYVNSCAISDSACLLIKPKDFFLQQFKSDEVPFFSLNDSVVKINFKIKEVYNKEDFIGIIHNLKKKEDELIENYFGAFDKMELAKDSRGFYWIERTMNYAGDAPKIGDLVSVSYKGSFLNGRFLEKSDANFELIYGTPDQLLKGLNFVIGQLKLGENAKIILPSRLAFGENGSSNGTVPPYTPLVYEIQLIDIKTKTIDQ